MKSLIAKHKVLWSDRFFVIAVMIGFLFFACSLLANYGATQYAAAEAANPTTDILLDNLPVVNTDIIVSEGALLFVVFIGFLFVKEPRVIPFTLKSVAMFIFVRSFFVIMTHYGPFPDHITTDLDGLRYIGSAADLFFSGHVGLPFLMALLFWENKHLRLTFLVCSVIAAAAVILGHLHYTIDVFSAFFITYGICHVSQWAFKKDYELFICGLQTDKLI
jgi:hypothetical protein